MLKFFKEHAASIDGISLYPILSLLIFFIFFVVLLYYVKKMDKNKVQEISRIPLDADEQPNEPLLQNNLKQA